MAIKTEFTSADEVGFWVEIKVKLYCSGEKALQNVRTSQQLPNRLFLNQSGVVRVKAGRAKRLDDTPKQTTKALSRFDLYIDVGRLLERHDE